jgi:hypothetical protein
MVAMARAAAYAGHGKKHILLETVSPAKLFENIHRLAELRANSKRKRLPALYRLLAPK